MGIRRKPLSWTFDGLRNVSFALWNRDMLCNMYQIMLCVQELDLLLQNKQKFSETTYSKSFLYNKFDLKTIRFNNLKGKTIKGLL